MSYLERVFRTTERENRRAILAAVRPIEGGRMLDLGCASGHFTIELARRAQAGEIHGVEFVEDWAADARGRGIQVVATDLAERLPYDDASFDCIYAWSVFSHIDEPAQEAWLLELRRILAPDGTLLVSILGEESPAVGEAESRLDRRRLMRDGFAFCSYPVGGAGYDELVGSDQDDYGLAYVTRAHVRERWSRWLDVAKILPLELDSIQDIVVMRRPAAGVPGQASKATIPQREASQVESG